MADAAVEILLNNLCDLLLYHLHLITDTKDEIESLEKDLRLFNAFLKDSLKQRRKDEFTKVLVGEIRGVAYELEDVIDAFVTHASKKIKSTREKLKFWKPAVSLHDIGKKVEVVKKKVEAATATFAGLRADLRDKDEKHEAQQLREKNVVGFADVTEDLISRLIKETDYLDVISVTGMFGQGKTTLAWKIYNDPKVSLQFPVRIWLSISQEFSDKDIFLAILGKLTTVDKNTRQLGDWEIKQMIKGHLEGRTFLIVMDDVWETTHWDRLWNAIPINCIKGKILMTSRITKVGAYASKPRPPNELRLFTEEESWELLRLEALCKLDCPSDLETVGKLIARDCHKLPLALVIIGGILATKYSVSDIGLTKNKWEEVSTRVKEYINENDPVIQDPAGNHLAKIISLSYDILPYHLRACFLYLGMFPEDYKIPASTLIRMWIGEGLIQEDNVRTLEQTGEMYLEDLINRNLVTIEKLKANGKVKTCRVHDILREFCQKEAASENENFLQEIKSIRGKFVPSIGDIYKYRHLSIHSNCLEFISSKPSGPRVRSFVCFPKTGFTLPEENIVDILRAFRSLRVLDVRSIKFIKITSHMYQLVQARYIALSLECSVLPSKFSQLWNIQTLIVHTASLALEVRADIWKLTRLRHFKTNVPATLPKPSTSGKHGAELQTFGIVSVESCTAELLEWACKLKKLAIGGLLEAFLEGKLGSFAALKKMRFLEKLKLVNDVLASQGKLSGLPTAEQFPPNIKSLTLVATKLDWECMAILGLLKKLEVLKLKSDAFVGSTWKADDGGFKCLEFLEIEETDLCVWEASSQHFPRLKGLVLNRCDNLVGIPIGLAGIASFQKLELFHCNSSAVSSSKRIQEAKKNAQAQGFAFKLSIFPPNQ